METVTTSKSQVSNGDTSRVSNQESISQFYSLKKQTFMETKNHPMPPVPCTAAPCVKSLHKNNFEFSLKQKLLALLVIIAFCINANAQTPSGIISTVVGNGTGGYSGDGGQATAAALNGPADVVFDAAGNMYIADQVNNLIRQVSPSGIITTIAGGGTSLGDGGPATNAQLAAPTGVTLDAAGNLYIADQYTYRIRKVTVSTGIITTVAGNGNPTYAGDGGQATNASLFNPTSVAFDATGNMYIADYSNNVIRMVNASGIITTFAGNGTQSFSGDGGQATNATFSGPVGVAFDAAGNLYIADRNNNRIRIVNPSGIINTFAGNGTAGYTGNGGQAISAEFNGPFGLDLDATGNLYISDLYNNVVRMINPSGIISTIAGNGTQGYSGDGGPATAAELYFPAETALGVNASGNLFIADYGNNRVRMVIPASNPQIGSSCANPILVNNVSSFNSNSFSGKTNLNNVWFSFTAQNDTTRIIIFNNNQNKNDDYQIINIYGGGCSSLNLVQSYTANSVYGDSVYEVITTNLIEGQQYYVQLNRKHISSDSSQLSMIINASYRTQSGNLYMENECASQGLSTNLARGLAGADPLYIAADWYGISYKILSSSTATISQWHTDVAIWIIAQTNGVPTKILDITQSSYTSTNFNLPLLLNSYYLGVDATNVAAPPGTHLDIQLEFVNAASQIVASTTFSIFSGNPVQVANTSITYCTANPLTITPINDPNYPSYDFHNLIGGSEVDPPLVSGSSATFSAGQLTGVSQISIEPGLGSTCAGQPAIITLHPISPSSSIVVTPSSDYICHGQSVQISASGANSYLVTDNVDNNQISGSGSNFTFNITPPVAGINNVYTISSVLPSCANPATSVIHVYPNANFNLTTTTPIICPGATAILTAESASGLPYSYVWSGGGVTQSCASSVNPCSISVTPTSFPTTYNVVATDVNGCSFTKSITISNPTGYTPAAITVPYAFQCEALNSLVSISAAPNGYESYSWTFNPANGATIQTGGTDPTVLINCSHATGNVILELTTESQGCYSNTSIVIEQCCAAGRNIAHHENYNLGTNIYPAGYNFYTVQNSVNYINTNPAETVNYFVTGQLVFEGTSNIEGVNFIMNPGSSIVVDGGAILNITNSHIYACSDMWQGISFNTLYALTGSGNPQTPYLNVTNSLIEDAIYGVNIAYGSVPISNYQSELLANGQAAQPVVTLNNAWFNRCAAGIISDYDPLHPDSMLNLNADSPYDHFSTNQLFNSGVIIASNCVFSCLNGITMNRVNAPNYNTGGLAADYLHNYMYTPNFYSFCGIAANSTSFGTTNTINSCYFDNLVDGIISYNNPYNLYTSSYATDYYTPATSNLNVTSCSFNRIQLSYPSPNYNFITNYAYAVKDMNGYPVGGAFYYPYYYFGGSGGNPAATVGAGINFFGSQLNVGGSSATGCTFTNSNYGIIAKPDGQSQVNITYNSFSGTTGSGIYMNDLNSSQISQPITITNNTFKDHFQQGINLIFLDYGDINSISASDNNFTISSSYNTYWQSLFQTPSTFIYAPQAISVTSFGLENPYYGSNYISFSIYGNTIHGYEKGIQVQSAYYTSINSNTIDGMPNDQNNATYGISLTNCNNSSVILNTVKAPNTSSVPWMYSQDGIVMINSANSQILCNTIDGPDVSMYCAGSNNTSSIEGNAFHNAQPFNFWLDDNGMVGTQGSASLGSGNTFTRDNTYTWTDALFAGNGSNGNYSPFYYTNSGTQVPLPSVYSGAPPTAAILTYALHRGAPYFNCNGFRKGTPILNPATAQKIALDSIQFSNYDTTAIYGNQHDLYRALIDTGAAFYTANPVLNIYMLSMVGSSHEKLLVTDTLLANAGTDSSIINQAIAINNSFIPVGKHDAYLQKINNLYAAYKKAKKRLNIAQVQDVRTIALLCPYEYGEGVYKARALLTLYDTLIYINTCEALNPPNLSSSSSRVESIETSIVSEPTIQVYPNPANNMIYMQGLKLNEGDKAEIEIYSSIGQLVLKTGYSKAIQATDVNNIDISALNSGSYMYKVMLNGVVMQVDKLIILK